LRLKGPVLAVPAPDGKYLKNDAQEYWTCLPDPDPIFSAWDKDYNDVDK